MTVKPNPVGVALILAAACLVFFWTPLTWFFFH